MTSSELCHLLLAMTLSFACGERPPTDPVPDAGPLPHDAAQDAFEPPTDGSVPDPVVARFPDRAIVRLLRVEARSASRPGQPPTSSLGRRGQPPTWWIEERLAPQPLVPGDFDLGPRAIVRWDGTRSVVWTPGEHERLVDVCLHEHDGWSAVGIDGERRVFVAHGDVGGLSTRSTLDDPTLRDEPLAWLDANARERGLLRVGVLSEASPKIVCDGDDVVVSLMSDQLAVLVYRLGSSGSSTRTLVAPATTATPFLPIGGSYDDFDAMVAPYVTHLALTPTSTSRHPGRVFVAWLADRTRVLRYNAALGTTLDLIRERLYPREATYDSFVAGVDRDGTRAFTSVVGVPDVEDELFGIAVGDARVAVIGRHRRELGRDNVELHAMVSELDHDGHPLATTSLDLEGSALAQAAAYDGDALWVGGTEGWRQNPSGRSVFEPGSPFLVRLSGGDDRSAPRAIEPAPALVPPTSGHAELRALLRADDGSWAFGGHENGPLTHTADSDPSRVRSDAWLQTGP